MVPPVVHWGDFRRLRPDLAEAGRRLLYQFGVGLGFLGTVRADGGPRIHPICPLLTDDGLYAFLAPSLKRDDLRRSPLRAAYLSVAAERGRLLHDRDRPACRRHADGGGAPRPVPR